MALHRRWDAGQATILYVRDTLGKMLGVPGMLVTLSRVRPDLLLAPGMSAATLGPSFRGFGMVLAFMGPHGGMSMVAARFGLTAAQAQ